MTRYLLTFLFIASIGYVTAQKLEETEVREMMWGKPEKEFTITDVPEKWQEKSAVKLAASYHESYKQIFLTKFLWHTSFLHERVKIQSKKALEEYAQFDIPSEQRMGYETYLFFAGFKVIKPDGKEIIVPLSDAVEQEREIDNMDFSTKKLAIPNLEVGDIIDYYYVQNRRLVAYNYYVFRPVIFNLGEEYPVLYQKISFQSAKKWYLNIKSLNGAPEFKFKSTEEEDYYYIVDRDREDVDFSRWFDKYRQLPTIKYKVTYAKPTYAYQLPLFLGEAGGVKSNVSREEIRKFMSAMISPVLSKSLKKDTKKLVKYYKKNPASQIEKLEDVFYKERYRQVKWSERNLVNGEGYGATRANSRYLGNLSYVLKRLEIPHKILVGVPKHISSIDDMILENELTYMIKTNIDTVLYFGINNDYATMYDGSHLLEGTKVYEVDGLLPASLWSLKEATYPETSHQQNTTTANITLAIDDIEEGTIDAVIRKEVLGHGKVYYQSRFLDFFDFVDEEVNSIGNRVVDDLWSYEISSFIEKRDAYKENRDENKKELQEEMLKNDFSFELSEVEDLKIINTGRMNDSPGFIYEHEMKLEGPLKKVGRDYMLNIGAFIEEQVDIEKEEIDRKYDVNMPYARSFNYTIQFNIPEGYQVEGIENLRFNVDNKVGSFITEAVIENGILIVKTLKTYKSAFVSKEDWPKMLEYLMVAKAFNNKNVLLKKST